MGTETRECVSGGVFDGTAPSCERKNAIDLMNGLYMIFLSVS